MSREMSLVGAVTVTCATVCYLVALCMFFNPNAKMKALRVASFCMLIFFLASAAVAVIRWLQVYAYRVKKCENSYYYKKRKRFRAALITLGALCTLFVLVSAVGIFLFASIFSNVTSGLLTRANNMLEVTGRNRSSNTSSIHSNETDTGDKDRKLKLQNLDSDPDNANANKTSSGRSGRIKGRIKNIGRKTKRRMEAEEPRDRCGKRGCKDNEKEDDGTNKHDEDSSTDSPPAVTEPFPEGHQHCRNRTTYPTRRARKNCRKGEPVEQSTEEMPETNHCKNRTAFPTFRGRLECRIEGLERRQAGFVTKKFVLAAFLGLSFIGHLINVCVALCCNGDPADPEEEGYEMAEYENDGTAGEEKDKLCS